MEISTVLDDFFEEQFSNTTKYYLYKDKQILKENNYSRFADKQINRAKKLVGLIPGLLLFLFWSVKCFIHYGAASTTMSLIFGIVSLLCFIGILFVATKEYYTITSSMSLFKKLINKNRGRVHSIQQ